MKVMKRRVLQEDDVIGPDEQDVPLLSEVSESSSGAGAVTGSISNKMKSLATTNPKCFCCCKCFGAFLVVMTVLIVLAAQNPFGVGDGWKADDVWTKTGTRDEEYPQKLAYLPSELVDKEEDGEYTSVLEPKIAAPMQYMGKPHFVDDKNDPVTALKKYTAMRDGYCGRPGSKSSKWDSHTPADKSPHVKDFCVKQRNTPDAVTDLPYAWCNETAAYELHFCRVPDETTEGDANKETDAWTILRVGPFETTGGYDWNGVVWKGQLADIAEELIKQGSDALYIDAAFAATMHPDGQYYGYPPLHAHHFHLSFNDDLVGPADFEAQLKETPVPRFYNGWTLIHEFHGDTSCKDAEGGIGCQYEGFPADTAIKIPLDEYYKGNHDSRGLLSMNCEFNDARAAGSDPIVWYLETAVHHYSGVVSTVGEADAAMSKSKSKPPPAMVISRDTVAPTFLPFPIPYFTPSVTWNSHVFDYVDRDNEIISIYVHTHHTILDSQWLFQASAEDLGLTPEHSYTLQTHVWWKDFVPASKGKTVTDVKRHVLNSLAEAQAKWDAENPDMADRTEAAKAKSGYPRALCKTTSTSLDFINGHLHDRQIPIQCASDFTKIDKGLRVTAVHFNRASSIEHVSGIVRRLLGMRKYGYYSGGMQHNFWRFVYAERNSPDYVTHNDFYVVARPEDGLDTPSANTKILPGPRGFAPTRISDMIPIFMDMLHLHFMDWFQ
mmetsp:Transcript_18846/g.24456  ORF Transcript_18846/g.24456 Transcript_18846/m.24456 type:complete len:719 (-) Transcript_18846:147-2303(-)|eukprot:CAMPEP_0197297324 /NCGR_PEP_ID=MMETSP0890-20130614/40749_1 /TAXON_ID=44058 ORGANISM="Aureoumbra lagunensis, Strain CCMP1510" /NCGR_SAMPLE_ID=MMETSP0890 /ASSEMBLY_ACC=CAM_ASM_000533 /LENGTH=718 /DNA_ID=CAMNT_0042774407 /DNA_START=188 /DNA_END=2344 /DNA_ORIENTATION=+